MRSPHQPNRNNHRFGFSLTFPIDRSPISIIVYYDMIFFTVDIGDDLWMNVLYLGLFEIPVLFLVAVCVKYGQRRILYMILYVTSGVGAFALIFTTESESPAFDFIFRIPAVVNLESRTVFPITSPRASPPTRFFPHAPPHIGGRYR